MKRLQTYLFLRIPNLPALLSQKHLPAAARRPLAVVTDTGDRGVVRSVSPEAEALGVRTGLFVRDLRRWNGALDLIPEQPRQRAAIAQEIVALLQKYAPAVKVIGEDRFLLDLSGTERLWGGAERVAEELLEQISKRWKVGAAIGIGPTRTVAKVAATVASIPGLCAVAPENVQAFLDPLPAERLPGVGSKTRAQLDRYGLQTIGELAALSEPVLIETFGPYRGLLLARLAQGRDVERLKVEKEVSSLRREAPLPQDTLDAEPLQAHGAYLCGRLALDLRRRKLAARRITLCVRYSDGLNRQINKALPAPTNLEVELARAARRLIEQMLPLRRVRIVHLAVSVSRLRPAGSQQALFDLRGFERHEAVADDVVRIRSRFGFNAVLSGRAQAATA